MLNMQLNRKVLLEKTFGALSVAARETIYRNPDKALTSGIMYTDPEKMPNGMGVLGLLVVIDTKTEEMTPQLITAGSDQEYLNMILQSTNMFRKAFRINGDQLKSHITINYSDFTGHSLATVSDIDVRPVVSIIGEMLAEDVAFVNQYIMATKGNRNQLMFEPACQQTNYGLVIKETNKFIFPDGLIVQVNSVGRNPDGSFSWDYDVVLGNEIMRGAKSDMAFANKNLNQQHNQNQFQPQGNGGYQSYQPNGYGNPYGGNNNGGNGFSGPGNGGSVNKW